MGTPPSAREGRRYRIRGLVQGVGFRPFVWRLAHEEGIAGFVLNDCDGVLIEAHAEAAALTRMEHRLIADAPPLSRIDAIEIGRLDTPSPADFAIRESLTGSITTGIVADAATCEACRLEIEDPSARRAGYAFTNCTHCGPRLTIVHAIPYDRANTSMSAFPMCPDCAREYADPADRRFHAEPIACPTCGPKLWLEIADAKKEIDPIAEAAGILASAGIVAIKGLGGFHLSCDAHCADAVARLRSRKRRDAKPFAVMVRDIDMALEIARISAEEEALLRASSAPIVLLRPRDHGLLLAADVAPGAQRIGLMLPSTPLHHLLLRAVNRPLVMTSGNASSEPQCVANAEARARLANIADAWLMHDRDIVNRADDSLVRVDAHGPTILRRARGYAPQPLELGAGFSSAAPALALGGELKSTFCFVRDGSATLSQHIGDLEEPRTRDDYRAALELYRRLYQIAPEVIAVDLHPDYAATRIGETLARETGARLHLVQHHHAHLAACLAENGVGIDDASSTPTLGIVLDGTGLGADGTIWGGELLVGSYTECKRVGHLAAVALPGGERAVREPWRNTLAHLVRAFGSGWLEYMNDLKLAHISAGQPVAGVERMIARGFNAPLASSTGRLFDAVAGALGICTIGQAYEGQTGMLLEALAEPHVGANAGYPFGLTEAQGCVIVDPTPMWRSFVVDLSRGTEIGAISARFHLGLVDAFCMAAIRISERHAIRRVALSGGVFANKILLDGLSRRLSEAHFSVLLHHKVPANDGGLALGQACIASASAV